MILNQTYTLSNGVQIPKLGLGTWFIRNAVAADAVRAAADLEAKGFKLNPDSAKYKGGRLTAVYLENEIGGFAVHLLQK